MSESHKFFQERPLDRCWGVFDLPPSNPETQQLFAEWKNLILQIAENIHDAELITITKSIKEKPHGIEYFSELEDQKLLALLADRLYKLFQPSTKVFVERAVASAFLGIGSYLSVYPTSQIVGIPLAAIGAVIGAKALRDACNGDPNLNALHDNVHDFMQYLDMRRFAASMS